MMSFRFKEIWEVREPAPKIKEDLNTQTILNTNTKEQTWMDLNLDLPFALLFPFTFIHLLLFCRNVSIFYIKESLLFNNHKLCAFVMNENLYLVWSQKATRKEIKKTQNILWVFWPFFPSFFLPNQEQQPKH